MLYFPTLISIIEVLLVTVPVLLTVAYVIVAERKTMASMQKRLGPNIVEYFGLLQAFVDALKLLLKEYVSPTQANLSLFFLGPIITLIFSLLGYLVVPYGPGLSLNDFNLGILYMLAVSSLATYGILLAGWSANSKYAFLGSLRSTAHVTNYNRIVLQSYNNFGVFIILIFMFVYLPELVSAQQKPLTPFTYGSWYCPNTLFTLAHPTSPLSFTTTYTEGASHIANWVTCPAVVPASTVTVTVCPTVIPSICLSAALAACAATHLSYKFIIVTSATGLFGGMVAYLQYLATFSGSTEIVARMYVISFLFVVGAFIFGVSANLVASAIYPILTS